MMLNIGNVLVDAKAGSIQVQRMLGGGIVATLQVETVVMPGGDRPKDGGRIPIEVQGVPSVVKLGSEVVGSTCSTRVEATTIDSTWTPTLGAVLELAHDEVVAIESARAGRALELTLDFRMVVRTTGSAGTWHVDGLRYRVASSDWADQLGALGVFSVLHVEVPLSGSVDLTTHAHLRNELHRAERLFRDADYSACVAVLRDVWEPIVKELAPSGRWDPILDKALPREVASLMSNYAGALRALLNKGHHRGVVSEAGGSPLYDFTAADAELIYSATVGFLRFLGRLAR
jgi:hypothetical protein